MTGVKVFLRLTVVGLVWVAALALFAALLQWSGSPEPQIGADRDGVTALARDLNRARPETADGEVTWTVTRATSALRALVVEVDAIDPDTAPDIARLLVNQAGEGYDEILIYVHALDRTRDPRTRRIEWTPRRGYLASDF